MTAIRKSGLQYVHFQRFTSKTTKIGYSNDRFGFTEYPYLYIGIYYISLFVNLTLILYHIGYNILL